LASLLRSADLVLAPSESAAHALAANGVAPHRLEVDENGLPDSVLAGAGSSRPSRPPTDGGPLRVLYTGGPNVMKGVDVLLDALGSLGSPGSPGSGAPSLQVSGFGVE